MEHNANFLDLNALLAVIKKEIEIEKGEPPPPGNRTTFSNDATCCTFLLTLPLRLPFQSHSCT